MIFYQLLLFVFFVFLAGGSGIHGYQDECNLNEQLNEHYLSAAYLDSFSGALYFNNGEKIAEILKNDPNEIRQIAEVDAIRIGINKFALLGYTVRNGGYKLIKMLVIEYDEENGFKKYYNHSVSDEIVLLYNITKAYYNKNESAIYVDENQRISIENGIFESGRQEKDDICFMENIYCAYDPYTQNLKVYNASQSSQILSTSSCNLDVIREDSVNGSKLYVSDGSKDGKFCLSKNAKYQKIFLFPNFSIYDRNGCDKTAILSKTMKPTPSLQFYPSTPEKRQTEFVPSTHAKTTTRKVPSVAAKKVFTIKTSTAAPKKTSKRKISNAPRQTITTIGLSETDSFNVTIFNPASNLMNQMNGFKLFGMILFGIIFAQFR